jgi:hypothetical protein
MADTSATGSGGQTATLDFVPSAQMAGESAEAYQRRIQGEWQDHYAATENINPDMTIPQVAGLSKLEQSALNKNSAGWQTAIRGRDSSAQGISPMYLGGSSGISQGIVDDLRAKGTDTLGMYTGLGDLSKSDQSRYAISADRTGTNALRTGLAGAAEVDPLQGYAERQFLGTPDAYGSTGTMAQWQNATQQGGQYSPSIATGRAAGALENYDGGPAAAQLYGSYDALNAYANSGPGPSAAEAQLRQAQDTNVAAQMALARSGRGAGANAQAMRGAQFQAANIGQQTAGDMATLRAQEAAQWRSQQLAALGQASGVAGAIDTSQVNRNAQGLSGLSSAANLYGSQDAAGLQARQFGASQYGAQYGAQASSQQAAKQDQMAALAQMGALQGQQYGQTRDAYSQSLAANAQGADIMARGDASKLAAYGAGTAADMGYNASALDVYTGNANRLTGASAQDKANAASAAAASRLESERNTDRLIGAAGAAAGTLATVAGGKK